jgi:hypothetical protein
VLVEYVMRLPVRCHAWNTVSRSGGREHGRSEDRVSQQKASALVTGRLAGPRGDRVSPEGRHAGGLCDAYPETDSCSHGRVLAEAWTVVSSLATANRSHSPGRETELGPRGLARDSVFSVSEDTGLTEPRNRCWLNMYDCGEIPCLEHGVSVGRRGTVDPKIACLNKRLLRSSQGGSLVPEGTEVDPEGRLAGGLCDSIRRLTAVRTVVCSPKRARWFAVGQPRTGRSLLEEKLS